MRKVRMFICFLLCASMLLLCSCVHSQKFLHDKEQGKYPTAANFPNTKWICNEIDLWFYMFDYDESYMIGEYTVNDKTYRAVGTFEFKELDFDIYSDTKITESKLDESVADKSVSCERVDAGFIYTNYLYENDKITCSVRNCGSVDGETIPEVLTFENVGTIAESVANRWYSEELDMSLESFNDAEGYLRGEIMIDGNKCFVHALEIGNNNYFTLSIENGTINNLKSNTVSPFCRMYFEYTDNGIVAKVSEEVLSNAESFVYWEYDVRTVTFS